MLGNGEPRVWITHWQHVGLGFSRIARHHRVTQFLGSLGGKEWLIGVAPPGDRVIKLLVATWHAGPHVAYDACQFVNSESLDSNRREFNAVPLPAECRYRL